MLDRFYDLQSRQSASIVRMICDVFVHFGEFVFATTAEAVTGTFDLIAAILASSAFALLMYWQLSDSPLMWIHMKGMPPLLSVLISKSSLHT